MAKTRTLGLKLKAIDRISNTIDRVKAKFPKLARSVRRTSRAFKIFNTQARAMRRTLQKVGGSLKRFGKGMTLGLTLPIVAAGAAGVKMFSDFEQGLRGIEKTTGLSRGAVAKLGLTFDQLSTEIPVTTKEMLELAKVGGQFGVKGVKNLEKFTVVMSKLLRTAEGLGEEGAQSIARILNITGEGIGVIDRFGSALTFLGNEAAASESDILAVATRIAGQIGRFDVGAAKILGLATALKELGKKAEEAGSVTGRAFDAIDQTIRKGGEKLEFLSRLTGIAGKDLKKAFGKDAFAVFQKLIGGLTEVEKREGNQVKVLAELGLKGVRINSILLTLAKRQEILTLRVGESTKAWRENTALQKEFEIQTDSFGSEMIKLTNTFTSLLRLIGEELAPAVQFFGKIFKGILNFLRNNPTIRTLVIVFAALAAVLGPLLVLVGGFLIVLPLLIAGMAALGVASFPITGTMLLIGAAVIALIVGIVILIKNWEKLTKFFDESPLAQIAKAFFFLGTPIGQAIIAIRLLLSLFTDL